MSMTRPLRETEPTSTRAGSETVPERALLVAGGAEQFSLLQASARFGSDPAPVNEPTPSDPTELVDVVVRLPRKAIEETLLSARACDRTLAERRLAEARALQTGRRQRKACFPKVYFHEPSWDMILELYVATRECRSVFVSQLCSLSGGSMTTALRHIKHLEALGHLSRQTDATDRRRANVVMRPSLASAVERWLDLQRAALRIGR